MRIDIDSNAPAVALALRRLQGNFMPAIARNMRLAVAEVERTLKANVSGPIIKRRTGKLMNSIRSKVTVDGTGVTGEVGVVKIPYAHILETGGTITGKPWLTIPLPGYGPASSAHPGGETRLRAREIPNAFFLRSKRGNLLLMQRKGKQLVPVYVLKHSVRIPAFGYLRKTLEQTQGVLPNILQQGLLDAD